MITAQLLAALSIRRITPTAPATIGPPATGSEVAARAWRIYPLKGQGDNIQASEIQFKHTIGGENTVTSRTPIFNTQFNTTTFAAVNAFDNNTATQWAGIGQYRNWIGIDYGVGESMVLREVIINRSGPFPTQQHLVCLVEYSQDLVTWFPYGIFPDGVIGDTIIGAVDTTATITPNMNIPVLTAGTLLRRYSEIRFVGNSPINNFVGVGKLQLLDAYGRDIYATREGIISARGWQSGFEPINAFNPQSTGAWRDNNGTSNSFLRLDHGDATKQRLAAVTINREAGQSVFPAAFVIRTSDDLSTWNYHWFDYDRNPNEMVGRNFANTNPMDPVVESVSATTTSVAQFPPSIQEGDLLLLFIGHGVGSGSCNPGSKWTRVREYQNSGSNSRADLFFCIANGTETGTFPTNPSAGASNNFTTAVVRIRNADTLLPLVSVNQTGLNTNGTTRAMPQSRITRNNQLALIFYTGGWGQNSISTYPAGYTKLVDVQSTTVGSGGTTLSIGQKNVTKRGEDTIGNISISITSTYSAFSVVVEGKSTDAPPPAPPEQVEFVETMLYLEHGRFPNALSLAETDIYIEHGLFPNALSIPEVDVYIEVLL